MKKTKVLLAGALVLALGLVMGCKAPTSGTSEDWDPNTDTQKTWKKSNTDAEKTLRAFEGFGALDINNGAVVKIEIGNSKASKAGVLFDYKEYSKVNGTVCYYQLGIGTSGYDGQTPEFYLTKVTDIKPDQITASTTSDSASGGAGQTVDIQNNVSFAVAATGTDVVASNMYTLDQNGKLITYVGFIRDEVAGSGSEKTYVVKVRIGMYEEGKGWKENAYLEKELKDGKNWTGNTVSAIDGKLCAYAMLKKADKGEVSTENTYKLINRTGKMADAE